MENNFEKGYHRMTIDQISDDGCMNLLEAFVSETGREYCCAYIKYMERPYDKHYIERKDRIEEFIMSEYFGEITGLPQRAVLEELTRKCRKAGVKGYGKILSSYQYKRP